MTIPDETRPRIAACLSDAGFSCRVLTELRACNLQPSLVFLPEFAPAVADSQVDLVRSPMRAILSLIGDLPLHYAALDDEAVLETVMRAAGIDYLLVACWPRLLGPRMRAAATQAALNLHPSRLPAYRGADPVGEQLGADEQALGVTLHLLDDRFDHGDIIAQASFSLAEGDRSRSRIESEAARRGVALLQEAIRLGPAGWCRRSQDQAFETD